MIDEGRHADLLPQPPGLGGGEAGGEPDDEHEDSELDANGGAPAAGGGAARGGASFPTARTPSSSTPARPARRRLRACCMKRAGSSTRARACSTSV